MNALALATLYVWIAVGLVMLFAVAVEIEHSIDEASQGDDVDWINEAACAATPGAHAYGELLRRQRMSALAEVPAIGAYSQRIAV